MKRLTAGTLLALAVTLPLLMAPTGGFPSRPFFQSVTIAGQDTSGNTLLQSSNFAGTLQQQLNNTNTVSGNTARLSISAGTSNVQIGACNQNQSTLCKLTGGPTAASGWIETFGNIPLVLGTGNGSQLTLNNNGATATGITIGAPTGGDKGIGTLNATAVYQGGVQVAQSPIVCTTACSVASIAVGQSVIIYKSGSTSRASTTALAIDPDLQFTALPAGSYKIETAINWSAGAGGFKYELMPNNCVGSTSGGVVGSAQTATTVTQNVSINPQTFAGTGDVAVSYGILTSINVPWGVCWAQNTSNAANTNLLGANSFVELTRLQ